MPATWPTAAVAAAAPAETAVGSVLVGAVESADPVVGSPPGASVAGGVSGAEPPRRAARAESVFARAPLETGLGSAPVAGFEPVVLVAAGALASFPVGSAAVSVIGWLPDPGSGRHIGEAA
jgi:hypothetical protein